nr:hypothetical protein [uncultured Mediterranean phage uvMED]
MNEDQIKKDMIMSLIKIETLDKKLSIATTGLKAIISNNSDTLNIAQKTLDELGKVDLPRKEL